jgi:uncharacterized protein
MCHQVIEKVLKAFISQNSDEMPIKTHNPLKSSHICGKAFSSETVILYGLYAQGNAHYDGDIDVAVVFDHYDNSILDGLQSLYKLHRNIDDRIEPVLLEDQEDKIGFTKHVRQTGCLIYSEI